MKISVYMSRSVSLPHISLQITGAEFLRLIGKESFDGVFPASPLEEGWPHRVTISRHEKEWFLVYGSGEAVKLRPVGRYAGPGGWQALLDRASSDPAGLRDTIILQATTSVKQFHCTSAQLGTTNVTLRYPGFSSGRASFVFDPFIEPDVRAPRRRALVVKRRKPSEKAGKAAPAGSRLGGRSIVPDERGDQILAQLREAKASFLSAVSEAQKAGLEIAIGPNGPESAHPLTGKEKLHVRQVRLISDTL